MTPAPRTSLSFVAILLICAAATAQTSTLVRLPVIGQSGIPNDGLDDTTSFQAAVATCNSTPGAVTLILMTGTYHIALPSQASSSPPTLDVTKDVITIEGNGSTILRTGFNRTTGIDNGELWRFTDSAQVTVRNLTLDMSTPSFIQGEVLPTTLGGSVDIRVRDAAMFLPPGTTGLPLASMWPINSDGDPDLRGVLYTDHMHTTTGLCALAILLQTATYQDIRITPQGTNTAAITGAISRILPGQQLVVRCDAYGGTSFYFRNPTASMQAGMTVLMEDVNLVRAPGLGILSENNRNVTLRRVRIQPAAGQFLSTTADGFHVSGNRNGSVRVEDCTFAYTGDDAINVHGRWATISSCSTLQSVVQVQGAKGNPWGFSLQAGDTIELLNPDLSSLGQATVSASQHRWGPPETWGATVTAPTPAFSTWMSAHPSGSTNNPVYVLRSLPNNLTITDSIFRGMRGRGAVIRCPNASVLKSSFTGTTGPGVMAMTGFHDTEAYEAGFPSNLLIDTCTFNRACGNGGTWYHFGSIHIEASASDPVYWPTARARYAPLGVINGATVQGCTLVDCDLAGIFCTSTAGLVVDRCLFKNISKNWSDYCELPAASGFPPEYQYAIYRENTSSTITGCTYINVLNQVH